MLYILIGLLLIIIFCCLYFFNIYEFSYSVNSINYEETVSQIFISHFPLNALGLKIPFRKIKTNYKIVNDCRLLTIHHINKNSDKLIIDKITQGEKIKILAYPKGFISSTLIEVDIKY